MRNSAKSTSEKIYISFHLKISHKSVHFTDMRRIFRRNGNLSQTLKPIIIERASYCIQFEIGTETVKILKFKKMSQASEQIIIDLSEWRELESRRVREFGKELSMSKSPSRKKYENILMNLWIWDTENFFFCLQVNIYNKLLFLKKWLNLTSSREIRRSVSVP